MHVTRREVRHGRSGRGIGEGPGAVSTTWVRELAHSPRPRKSPSRITNGLIGRKSTKPRPPSSAFASGALEAQGELRSAFSQQIWLILFVSCIGGLVGAAAIHFSAR